MQSDELVSLAKIFGVVFWGAIVLWTYKDARRRIDDPILVATSVATSMLPIVGVLVYLLLRPAETIAELRERQLEMRAMEQAIGRTERCPSCRSRIQADFLACPLCAQRLRQPCRSCERPLDPRWTVCPYCEVEVPRAASIPVGKDRSNAYTEAARRAQPTAESTRPASDSATQVIETEPVAPPTTATSKDD